MPLIDPVLGAPVAVPELAGFGYVDFPSSQPFSQRSASGYQESLEQVIRHLRKLSAYLQLTNPQGTWDANVTALIAAVDAALSDQSEANAVAIANALTAIAESQITITDPAMLAAFQAANSAARNYLDSRYAPISLVEKYTFLGQFYAPAPSGDDDTLLIKTALDWSQATGGMVHFTYGTYHCTKYEGASNVQQPRAQGQGKMKTFFKCTSSIPGATFIKLNGQSGPPSDGCLNDLSLIGADTVAVVLLELSGVCNFDFSRLRFEGVPTQDVQEQLRFHNEQPNSFTEFCVGHDVSFGYFNTMSIYYKVTAGNDSFHGSGVDGNTTFNQHDAYPATKGRIALDAAAKPYNAPLSATFFMTRTEAPVIENHSGLNPNFYGHLRVETQTDNSVPISLGLIGGQNPPVYYAGTVSTLGEVLMGSVYEVERVSFIGNNVAQKFAARSWNLKNCNGSTQIIDTVTLSQGVSIVSVEVIAANFYYSYLLAVQKNYSDGNGVVTALATGANTNNTAATAPTFQVTNGTLYVTTNASGYEVRAHQVPGFSFLH